MDEGEDFEALVREERLRIEAQRVEQTRAKLEARERSVAADRAAAADAASGADVAALAKRVARTLDKGGSELVYGITRHEGEANATMLPRTRAWIPAIGPEGSALYLSTRGRLFAGGRIGRKLVVYHWAKPRYVGGDAQAIREGLARLVAHHTPS